MTRRRIALLGLSYETLLRSPLGRSDMEVFRGGELVTRGLWIVRGAVERLHEAGAEILPIFWATALPGGALDAGTYAALRDEAVGGLCTAAPVDGVVVINHGALEVAGLDRHADGDFLAAVRAAVGDAVPISVALDHHGNVTPALLQAATTLTALRTAPHRDDHETGRRAADRLLRVIDGRLRPRRAAVTVPLMIPGELAVTTASPTRELFAQLERLDAVPGILDASLFVGFAWNDRPWCGMAVVVVAEHDATLARSLAREVAGRVWAARHDFRLTMESAAVEEGLARAAASPVRPIYLTDSGDNTTAGAPGDLTTVLREVLSLPEPVDAAVLGIRAPETARRCRAVGPGGALDIELGAEHVDATDPAREIVRAVVLAHGSVLQPRPGEAYFKTAGAWATVRIGRTVVSFHEASVGVTTPGMIEQMGIDPRGPQLVVVKLGYLHPHLAACAARHILLTTRGASALDLRGLGWDTIGPRFPLDPGTEWSAPAATFEAG
jgi:microcystin degradation protein MlrC